MLFRCPIICKTLVLVLVLTPLCDNQVLAVNLLVRNTHRRLDSFLEVGIVYLCEGLRAVPNGVLYLERRQPRPADGRIFGFVSFIFVFVRVIYMNISSS